VRHLNMLNALSRTGRPGIPRFDRTNLPGFADMSHNRRLGSVLLRKGSEMPIAIGLRSSLETSDSPPMVFHLNRGLRAGCRQ
jgi:hypothetical protein